MKIQTRRTFSIETTESFVNICPWDKILYHILTRNASAMCSLQISSYKTQALRLLHFNKQRGHLRGELVAKQKHTESKLLIALIKARF